MATAKDRTGLRYGALVCRERVIDDPRRPGRPRWLCDCDCGKTVIAVGDSLQSGLVTSCGCGTARAGAKTKDLAGQRFGRLTVVNPEGRTRVSLKWLCLCDCGKQIIAPGPSIRGGKITSCGCGRRTHGHSAGYDKSPTYKSWEAMIARTTYPSNPAFAHYQQRGITVCERWRNGDGNLSGFACFLADMGERPSTDHTLDRWPDNAGNYEPGNCRWATKREQANNRMTNRLVTYKGTQYTIADLARATGRSRDLLRTRITRMGWPVDEAVEAPLEPGRRRDLL